MILRLILFSALALLISCGSTKTAKTKGPTSAKEFAPIEWKQTKDTPPTYVPKNMDPKLEQTAETGEWYLDRDSGISYFVPFKGAGDASYSDVVASLPPKLADGSGTEPGPSLGERLPSMPSVGPFGKDKSKES